MLTPAKTAAQLHRRFVLARHLLCNRCIIDKPNADVQRSGMKRTGCVFFLMAALLTGGCAYYKIQPIPPASLEAWSKTNGLPDGYIFYQPELYFSATILTEAAKAGSSGQPRQTVTVTPLYLPNYQKPFRVTTRNFLAKSDFSFNFENGWKLTQISDQVDNSTLANTLAGQLQTILSATAGAGSFRLPATNAPQLRIILFRPVFDRDGYIESFKEIGAP